MMVMNTIQEGNAGQNVTIEWEDMESFMEATVNTLTLLESTWATQAHLHPCVSTPARHSSTRGRAVSIGSASQMGR